MINLYDKETGEKVGCAIKYDRLNKIEYNMFGFTGTESGRQTRVDCQGVPYVKTGGIFEKVKPGNFVIMKDGEFKQIDVYTMMSLYDVDQ